MCNQTILGTPIYRGHCSIDLLSVKASVVLDSAFCGLKNVLFHNIIIYCDEDGYIGKKSFYNKEKFVSYLNQCKEISKERVIGVLYLNDIFNNYFIQKGLM